MSPLDSCDFAGRAEAEALAGPVVDLANVGAKLFGGDLAQIGAFGQVLAQETVGVLVGAPLPGVVGMGKVDGQIQFLFQLGKEWVTPSLFTIRWRITGQPRLRGTVRPEPVA